MAELTFAEFMWRGIAGLVLLLVLVNWLLGRFVALLWRLRARRLALPDLDEGQAVDEAERVMMEAHHA